MNPIHSSMGPVSLGSISDGIAMLKERRRQRALEEKASVSDVLNTSKTSAQNITNRGDNSA